MNARVSKKEVKYKNVVDQLGFNLRPLIFEVYSGRLHQQFVGFIKSRCKVISNLRGSNFSLIYFQWRCKLDILIRQHHSDMILYNALQIQRKFNPRILPDYLYDPPRIHAFIDVVNSINDN